MDTAGSKMNLNFALRLQILWIKLDFVVLLFSVGLDKERITEIVVMEVKGRLVISISIRLDDLPVGDLGVLNKDVRIRHPLAIGPTHKPFYREPMIGFMGGRTRRRENGTQTQRKEDDPEPLPSWPPLPQNEARCSRNGFKQQNASPRQASPVLRRMFLA